MQGTIAVTDYGWYRFLSQSPGREEVNFWKPTATRTFKAPEFSPFFFKLKAPHHAICGFAYFARFARLPIWMAWETFAQGNGCATRREMESRLEKIRARIRFDPERARAGIGCILLVQPVFFREEDWIRPPEAWPARTVGDKKYDLRSGEGARIWAECRALASSYAYLPRPTHPPQVSRLADEGPRYGLPTVIHPRLGQGTFRIAVAEAYGWGCSITGEHSQPTLEAAHIKPYAEEGPHAVNNGLLLRADLHRLFDTGYLTVTPEQRILVSPRLKADFHNGKSYYPFNGERLNAPADPALRPSEAYLRWHNERVFLG